MKRKFPKCAEEKEKNKKDDGGADNKRADGKTEVKGGQIQTMFTSLVDLTSGIDFSEMGEDDKFTWYQFQVKGWGAQYFEGHAPVAMHNTKRAVPLTRLLLESQLTLDLIANAKMLVNIRKV